MHLIAEVQQSLDELRANTALTRQERVAMMESERRRLQVPLNRARLSPFASARILLVHTRAFMSPFVP